ncbi:MAG TPA: hypothetical protein VH912_14585 [Streptosporangiaceae bacterium]
MLHLLMRDFPGWPCWYGSATGAWWALPPPNCGYPRLVEAATPAQLAHRIHQIQATDRRIA